MGLSCSADGYMACGSEDNAVYLYHSSLSLPITRHGFPAAATVGPPGPPEPPAGPAFASTVCWSHAGHHLVAANSAGILQLLRLV